MKLKNLILSEGERDVKTILEDRLAETPYQVAPKVRLSSVIEKEAGEWLADDLFYYLTQAELDFLIIHRSHPNRPFLAVEFDGPIHELDAEQQTRDLRKNRLCQMAGLPVLRVRSDDIEPIFTHDNFLSYVVDVILRYTKGSDEFRCHDLADLKRLQIQLATKHDIISSDRSDKTPNVRFSYSFWLDGADNSNETFTIYGGRLILKQNDQSLPEQMWKLVHQISKDIVLRTHYRTTDQPRPSLDISNPLSIDEFVKWAERNPLYFPDLPGVNWPYIAWTILEALCLKQLLADVKDGRCGVRAVD